MQPKSEVGGMGFKICSLGTVISRNPLTRGENFNLTAPAG